MSPKSYTTNCKPVGSVIAYNGKRYVVKQVSAGDRCAECALISNPHCQGVEMLVVFGRCCRRQDGNVCFKETR